MSETRIVSVPGGHAIRLVPQKFEKHVSRIGGVSGGLGRGGHTRDFWSKVRRCGEAPGGCWEWIGYLDKDGYGKLTTIIDGRPRTVRPHRFLYQRAIGPIPDGLHLLHRCDNAACVNPDHLRPGTQRENIRECYARGRHENHGDNRGELSARTKLRNEDVLFIRSQRYAYGLVPLLASLYAVNPQVIACIRSRKTWRHLGNGNVQNAMTIAQLRALAESRKREVQSVDDLAQQRREDAA